MGLWGCGVGAVGLGLWGWGCRAGLWRGSENGLFENENENGVSRLKKVANSNKQFLFISFLRVSGLGFRVQGLGI